MMRFHDNVSSGNGYKVRLLLAQRGVEFASRTRQGPSGMWIAYSEEVPAARRQDETKEVAEENLRDATAFVLEDYSREQLQELRERLMSTRKEPSIL
jgi:predicted RNase H-like HicB family nuclease